MLLANTSDAVFGKHEDVSGRVEDSGAKKSRRLCDSAVRDAIK